MGVCSSRNKKKVNDAAARNYLSVFPKNGRGYRVYAFHPRRVTRYREERWRWKGKTLRAPFVLISSLKSMLHRINDAANEWREFPSAARNQGTILESQKEDTQGGRSSVNLIGFARGRRLIRDSRRNCTRVRRVGPRGTRRRIRKEAPLPSKRNFVSRLLWVFPAERVRTCVSEVLRKRKSVSESMNRTFRN